VKETPPGGGNFTPTPGGREWPSAGLNFDLVWTAALIVCRDCPARDLNPPSAMLDLGNASRPYDARIVARQLSADFREEAFQSVRKT
jgi:hypothetical protein